MMNNTNENKPVTIPIACQYMKIVKIKCKKRNRINSIRNNKTIATFFYNKLAKMIQQ